MTKILIILSLLMMTSCTITERYYLTGKTETILIDETVVLPPTHKHYEGQNNYCIHIDGWSYNYVDTFNLEVIKKRKVFTIK